MNRLWVFLVLLENISSLWAESAVCQTGRKVNDLQQQVQFIENFSKPTLTLIHPEHPELSKFADEEALLGWVSSMKLENRFWTTGYFQLPGDKKTSILFNNPSNAAPTIGWYQKIAGQTPVLVHPVSLGMSARLGIPSDDIWVVLADDKFQNFTLVRHYPAPFTVQQDLRAKWPRIKFEKDPYKNEAVIRMRAGDGFVMQMPSEWSLPRSGWETIKISEAPKFRGEFNEKIRETLASDTRGEIDDMEVEVVMRAGENYTVYILAEDDPISGQLDGFEFTSDGLSVKSLQSASLLRLKYFVRDNQTGEVFESPRHNMEFEAGFEGGPQVSYKSMEDAPRGEATEDPPPEDTP
jgi:hypothetical protein